MIRAAAGVAALILLGALRAAGAAPPLPETERLRLAEAFRLAAAVQDRVWPGWSAAPMDVLLVTAAHEYLVRPEPQPAPAGFESLGHDTLLDAEVLARPRVFAADLLATFPAFGGPATIVVGTAEATGMPSTDWVVTLLHEHFHQLQYSHPSYYDEVAGLELSGGDTTGMWMLTYPFPYDAPEVADLLGGLGRLLAYLLRPGATADPSSASRFWTAYAELEQALRPADYRYLSFQLWQEGIARYVEVLVAEAAAQGYEPLAGFRDLPDFRPYAELAASLREGILTGLRGASPAEERRVAFYAFGAGLGALLDREGGPWKERYLRQKFHLERYARPGG